MSAHRRLVLPILCCLGFTSYSAVSEDNRSLPKVFQGPEVLDALKAVKRYSELGLTPEYKVKGDGNFDRPIFVAKKLVISSGASFVFSELAYSRERNLIIAVEEIIIDPPEGVGTITWAKPEPVSQIPASRGRAPSGAHGQAEGEPGGRGTDGAPGSPGYAGRDAPNLYIFARAIKGGSLLVDLQGQQGGNGGQGQQGGDGGNGSSGAPASSSLFDCKRGPGQGGKAGDGGNAGPGGVGGRGGDGGTVILVSPDTRVSDLQALVRVEVKGGAGGNPGATGLQGRPGEPGQEGASAPPWCKSVGRVGQRGNLGAFVEGKEITQGPTGADGDFAVAPLTEFQFRNALTGGAQ